MRKTPEMEIILKQSFLAIILIASAAIHPTEARSSENLIGQGNDGNRSKPIHLIGLFDDQGNQIRSADTAPKPFSTRKTCGQCHDYDVIASGWHFNGHDAAVDAGRPGQPWVRVDPKTRTQVPISGRNWKGAFTPEEMGISPWEFVKQNFSHLPGGSYGEMEPGNPDEMIRKEISGSYEINCLACHNADPHQDQSEAAMQSARQNYRWIPAASSGLAEVKGIASSLDDFFDPEFDEGIQTIYKENLFNSEDKVFFDITNKPANERCYFCHSNHDLSISEKLHWTEDEDVHLKSGLNCVDCHRHGDDHMITRGIETEGPGKTLTCEGCHVGEDHHADAPELGRLGASKPLHRGIPTIHFEKLTCTACHSGPWPKENAGRWRTARIHQTGLHGTHNLNLQQPHIYAPVFMKGTDGKIGPYKVFWPAYWATVQDGQIVPLPPKDVLAKAEHILGQKAEKVDDWSPLTEQQIAEVLKQLSTEAAQAVYIAGGLLYHLPAAGEIKSEPHAAAEPYAWPMAHDVRPAKQSLGVRQCKDCHTTDAAFFFGNVEMDSPVKSDGGPEFVKMVELQGIDRLYMWAFNYSFIFRPFLKIVTLAACGLIGLVLLTYVVKGIAALSNACAKEDA